MACKTWNLKILDVTFDIEIFNTVVGKQTVYGDVIHFNEWAKLKIKCTVACIVFFFFLLLSAHSKSIIMSQAKLSLNKVKGRQLWWWNSDVQEWRHKQGPFTQVTMWHRCANLCSDTHSVLYKHVRHGTLIHFLWEITFSYFLSFTECAVYGKVIAFKLTNKHRALVTLSHSLHTKLHRILATFDWKWCNFCFSLFFLFFSTIVLISG